MYVVIACRIMTCSISKDFVTYHGSMECEINYNYNLGGVGGIQFYEGVKDFVGKDGVVIVEVVAGCVFNVCMEYLCYSLIIDLL